MTEIIDLLNVRHKRKVAKYTAKLAASLVEMEKNGAAIAPYSKLRTGEMVILVPDQVFSLFRKLKSKQN